MKTSLSAQTAKTTKTTKTTKATKTAPSTRAAQTAKAMNAAPTAPTVFRHALLALLLAGGAVACESASSSPDDARPGPSTSKPALRQGETFDGATPCGVDAPPCEGGLQCATVDLEGGDGSPLCVDPAAACAKLQCAAGECGILESFPAVITCLAGDD